MSILVGCLDEIFFHGRPVLVGVEPASMTWFLGQKAHDRSGRPGAVLLRDWSALEYVAADAGTGLQKRGSPPCNRSVRGREAVLENGLDVFHTTEERGGVARELERGGAPLGAGRSGDPSGRAGAAAGPGCPGRGGRARVAWKKAEAAFEQYERGEAGWKRVHGALAVFRPEGQLNDRAWAEQQIAVVLSLLSGCAESKGGAVLFSGQGDVDVPGSSAPSKT